ncbi:uncharacterized protein BXZ73DRAFT_82660 [Epithele typhae]|uniref:uncharacterized protein n=1 Tax=Epithele typhae TaxID=378194 RepID=UPI00200887A9|nr:uncharacterized protein BXZ73DRAFT_82660 [Epithele typhae]KAH9911668.1 hypothetical protein BXZ73DRAFT_82660 [Epithele typhae]
MVQAWSKTLCSQIFRVVNTRSLTERLPNEVLAHIFLLATHDTRQARSLDSDPEDLVPIGTLLSLTHVCQRWRQVAIDFPLLWTHIDLHDSRQFAAFEQRSRGLPLSLRINRDDIFRITRDGKCEDDKWAIEINSGEIFTTACDDERVDDEYAMGKLIASVADRLGTLDIIPMLEDGQSPRWLREKMCLPRLEETSNLKALAMNGSGDWVPSNHFVHLTHLLISWEYEDDDTTLYQLLSRTPNLEILELENIGTCRGTPERPASLQRLRSITFLASNGHAVDLFKFCSTTNPFPLRMTATHILISDALDTLNCLPSVHQATDLDIRIGTELRNVHFVLQSVVAGFWLQGRTVEPGAAHDWFLPHVLHLHAHAPLSAVTSVTLDVPFIEASGLVDVLRHVPRLETLKLRLSTPVRARAADNEVRRGLRAAGGPATQVAHLCAALCERAAEPSPDPAPALCPALRALALCSNMCRETAKLPDDVGRYAGALEDVARARRAMGCPLRELVVQPMSASVLPGDRQAAQKRFGEQLPQLVELFEFLGPGDDIFGDFAVREFWSVDGEDRYWTRDDDWRPQFDRGHLPW